MLNQQELLDKVKVYNNYIDENVVKKAYNFAFDVHKNQKRLSGDPYISHPIAVAAILCDLKVDTATITTALLHDTIEDTEATYSEVNKLFGKEIADLVEGVTKISRLEDKSKEYSVAENFRKLILATSKDIRVLLVKLADRLHNMRTINNITNPDKRLRIAKETMEIYSPLAERMGMHNFRDELEDLAFNVLNPDARKLITDRLILNKESLGVTFSDISKKIIKLLEEKDIKAKVTGREKNSFFYLEKNTK
jgi:GTP diphosphokinase / guanosine-3',5'-bis(diphosphate) 3'-diphosphatase